MREGGINKFLEEDLYLDSLHTEIVTCILKQKQCLF